MTLHQYHTSLRSRPIAETLHHAQTYAARFGISRVTDITRLDQVGMPVAAAIRPAAMEGSLCVNAGKGMTLQEAMVGAYMESIESYLAEPGKAGLQVHQGQLADVLQCKQDPEAILQLCPRIGAALDMAAPVELIEARELSTGQRSWLPAELVYVPYQVPDPGYHTYFGSSSNGLASGNNREEAIIHGIYEVIERDAMAFQAVHDDSWFIEASSWPEPIKAMEQKLNKAGLQLVIRQRNHELGLPYFMAVIIDTVFENPVYLSAGYGCHQLRDIALMRAASEAIQSRLSFIHGGRDDLVDAFRGLRTMDEAQKQAHFKKLNQALANPMRQRKLQEVKEYHWEYINSDEYLNCLLSHLKQHNFEQVWTVAFSKPDEPLQAVKTVIPGLEHYSKQNKRMGPRLKAYVQQRQDLSLRRS